MTFYQLFFQALRFPIAKHYSGGTDEARVSIHRQITTIYETISQARMFRVFQNTLQLVLQMNRDAHMKMLQISIPGQKNIGPEWVEVWLVCLLPLGTAGLEWELFRRVWYFYCWWYLGISSCHHLFSIHHLHTFQSLQEEKRTDVRVISL